MNGLYVFFIAIIIAIIIFYFFSRYLSKKYPHRATYLWPPILLTVCASIVLVLSFFLEKDGWAMMSYYFFTISIVAGAFIGTFIPKLQIKTPKK